MNLWEHSLVNNSHGIMAQKCTSPNQAFHGHFCHQQKIQRLFLKWYFIEQQIVHKLGDFKNKIDMKPKGMMLQNDL